MWNCLAMGNAEEVRQTLNGYNFVETDTDGVTVFVIDENKEVVEDLQKRLPANPIIYK